jgi:DnaA family protein
MDHLMTRFARDLGSLMALLDRLDAYGLARHRRITVPLLRQMLAEEGAAGALEVAAPAPLPQASAA